MAIERVPNITGVEGAGSKNGYGGTPSVVAPELHPKESSLSSPFSREDQEKRPLDEKALQNALSKLEDMSKVFGRHLRFEVKKDPDLVQVSVIDSSTEEVVRKIPPDEVVHMIEQVDRMIGVLFDRSA